MGRGFSRNRGIQESKNEFIVFCDSSNSLSENFIEKATKCLSSTNSTAVYGKIVGNKIHNDLCSKWREINLFLETQFFQSTENIQFNFTTELCGYGIS